MKSVSLLGLFGLILGSASALAADRVLIERYYFAEGLKIDSVPYRVNPTQGLAWAEIHTSKLREPGVNKPIYEVRAAEVPGLAYVAPRIVFTGSAGEVVCADVVSTPRKLLIRPTGACSFSSAKRRDGALDVFFNTK